jgi:predicted helicase
MAHEVIEFSEIRDHKQFEDLAAAYFRHLKNHTDNNIVSVFVEPSGEGTDGGRDIFVILKVDDGIMEFERKWVVQCKFHEESVNKSHLASVNIPSLIHQFNADGYLLICKNGVTSKLSEMFEDLRKRCRFGYKYLIWTGSEFATFVMDAKPLHKQFFPKYFRYSKNI